jgi:RHS repeat-associated protein
VIKSSVIRFGIALIALALWASIPAHAQYPGYFSNGDDTGFPSYGAFVSSSIDTVNLLNQGLILRIPFLSRKARGFDLSYSSQYESKYWVVDVSQVPVAGTALFTTYYHWRPDNVNGLWGGVTNTGGGIGYTEQMYSLAPCPYDDSDPPTVLVRSNWVYVGPDNTKYQLPIRKTYGVTGLPGCWAGFESDNLIGHTDQGHVQVDLTNSVNSIQNPNAGIIITRDDGTQISLSNFAQKDTNGNFITSTNQDTLGRSLFANITGTNVPGEAAYQYYDSNGTLQSILVDTTTLNITTAFPTTSYDQYHQVLQYSGGLGVVSKITLANGLSYSFSYIDPSTGQVNPFGEVMQVTLPTGGTIKYKWATVAQADAGPNVQNPLFNASIDSRVLVEKDVSEDGSTERVWTYSNGTATDPLGNKEIHQSFSNGGCSVNLSGQAPTSAVDPGVEYLDASGRVLKIVAYDYCYDYGPVYSAQQGVNLSSNQNFTYGLRNPRIIRTTVTLPDTGQVTKTETDFTDTYTYQVMGDSATYTDARVNPTETREYAYGSGGSGNLVRKTDTSYLHNAASQYLNAHIWNRVFLKAIYDGSGNLAAQTQYGYDSTAVTSFTGAPNHDDANYSASNTLRGNVTTIGRWLNTTGAWLTTTNVYNSVGNLVQTTDPGGHTYTLSYTDNFADGTNRNSQGFLTSVTGPVTNGVNHIEGKQYYWNSGLTAAVCGQNAPSPASCSNTLSPSAGSPVADYAKYTYDALGRPLTVTHGDGGATSFSFNEPTSPSPSSRISVSSSSTIDASNTLTNSVVIDGLGRVIETQLTSDPAGTDKVDTLYDEVGRVHSTTNPYRSTGDPTYGITTNVYDGVGRVTTLIPPDGTATANNVTTVYSGNSITVTDQAGKQRRSFTDAQGRLIEVDEPGAPAGATVSNGYAVISGTEQIGGGAPGVGTVTIGGFDQFTQVQQYPSCTLYDCGGNCLQWSNGSRDGSPTYVTVYDSGNILFTVNGQTTQVGYDQRSTPQNIAAAVALFFSSQPASVVTASANGAVVTFTAKTHGTSTNYSLSTSCATNDPSDFSGCSFAATPSGAALTGGANDFADTGTVSITVGGVQASATYGSGSTTSSIASALAAAINGSSSELVTASASGGTINFTDKTQGSPIPISTASSSNFPTVFSPISFSSAVSDEFLNAAAVAPAASLLVPSVTLYSYDALNNLICVEQHGNASGTGCSSSPSSDSSSPWRVRRFVYDSLGRLTSASNPESGTISYTYDADGNVLTKTDARGITTMLSYDQLHRVTQKSYSDGTPSVTFSYDLSSAWGASISNGIGRLVLITMPNNAGSELINYDSRGRLAQSWQCVPRVCGYESLYSYNFLGGITSQFVPGIYNTLTDSYDSAGRVTQLTSNLVDANHPATLATINSFTPAGAASQITYGNGLVETSAYNNRLQPTQMRTHNPTTNTDVLNLSYGFTNSAGANNGNLVTFDSSATQIFLRSYTYDQLNRLSTMSSPADASGCYGLSWSYDAWANRQSQNTTSGSCYSPSHAVLPNNRISGYSYDAAGNMTSDASHTYTYDAENRLTAVDGGTTAAYVYNSSGQRIAKTTPAGTTEYLYDQSGNVVSEINTSAQPATNYVYFNGSLLAEYENSTTYFIHKDHLGSTRVMTNVSGGVTNSMDYLPYGELSSSAVLVPVVDEGFENGTTGWVAGFWGCNSSTTTSQSHSGTSSLAQTGSTTGGSFQDVGGLTAGVQYQVSVWVKADAGTTAQVELWAHDTNGGNSVNTALITPGTGWQQLSLTFTADSTNAIRIHLYYAAGSGTIYYDDVLVQQVGGSGAGTTHLFTGKERDAESGLDDFEARHYSSSLGRFMQTDPIVVTTDRMLDPQQLNLYSYVRNNPTVLIDPTGETLTISGSLDQAQSYLQQIAGNGAFVDCDKKSNSCQITGNDGCDASVACPTGGSTANEGVNLLANLINSQYHYDFHVGDSIPTAGGYVGLDGDKRGSIEGNLDNKPDKNGNQKPATSRPPAGVDDEVAINPNYKGKFGSDNKLGTSPLWTLAFHELAEAYAKIDGSMAYLGAHAVAAARENILRDERPNLKTFNPGAGGNQHYDATDIKIKH